MNSLKTMKIHEIAHVIDGDWKRVNYAADPYLQSMKSIATLDEMYYLDRADSVVRYFLSNAGTWRGEVARAVKAELNKRLNDMTWEL